jgi:hypothetical protein
MRIRCMSKVSLRLDSEVDMRDTSNGFFKGKGLGKERNRCGSLVAGGEFTGYWSSSGGILILMICGTGMSGECGILYR